MKLKYQEKLDNLPSCPISNDHRTLKLYRLAKEDNISEEDLTPLMLESPNRFKGKDTECLSWGLSLHDTKKASEGTRRMLSKRRKKFSSIHSIKINIEMGKKHQSGINKNHYTVYPYEGIDLIPNFVKE